jgi:hypothetical protein
LWSDLIQVQDGQQATAIFVIYLFIKNTNIEELSEKPQKKRK